MHNEILTNQLIVMFMMLMATLLVWKLREQMERAVFDTFIIILGTVLLMSVCAIIASC